MRVLIFFRYVILITVIVLIACNKDDTQNQGTNFNLLLRTITKNNLDNGELITAFLYNSNNQVREVKTVPVNSPIISETTIETFYRDGAGRLDSIVLLMGANTTFTVYQRTIFHHDAGGRLDYSKSLIYSTNYTSVDSSEYVYNGAILQKRKDYVSTNGSPFSYSREVAYDFDATGNLSKAAFQWTTVPHVDTLRFEYDSKINPLPVDRLLFYWSPIFYTDYKPSNNPTLISTQIVSSYNNEYSYSVNNKPLYRKSREIGSQAIYETWYYYD